MVGVDFGVDSDIVDEGDEAQGDPELELLLLLLLL